MALDLTGRVLRPFLQYEDEKDSNGKVVGCKARVVLRIMADDTADPHLLADEIAALRAKKVAVNIIPEQGDLPFQGEGGGESTGPQEGDPD